jgi:16S rRNA G966 N2-methylase RsmD
MTPAEVLEGDCFEVLKQLADASVDSVVTDPPYGLSFMGKAWDYDVPKAEVWREVLRVLKPGGHLVAFFGSRTYHRGVVQIEDAGFEIRDSLMWLYGTGFPKSLNVGKAIDAAAGAERKGDGSTQRPELRVAYGKGAGALRCGQCGKSRNGTSCNCPMPAPATEAAAQWEGWGTALKPAHEPIVLARKPLVGTVAANVQAHGTGALNIDGCRIAGTKPLMGERTATIVAAKSMSGTSTGRTSTGEMTTEGRWPANVLLDEEAAAALDEQSGTLKTHGNTGTGTIQPFKSVAKGAEGARTYLPQPSDSGGASRFFYCAKASASERDRGCEHLPAKSGGEATDREDGSIGVDNPRAGAGRGGGRRNFHPTVKPIALMRWLVRLITPPGGTVLDPFTGSGTTGIAALEEGFNFLGIERDAAYAEIARARLAKPPKKQPMAQVVAIRPRKPRTERTQLQLFVGGAL